VSFDLDAARLEADERMRDGAREHVANLDGGAPPFAPTL
jgi:hypothetical protein